MGRWPEALNKVFVIVILEESNFNFRHVRLYDLDIPREKWLNCLQTADCSDAAGLHYLPITLLRISRLKRVNIPGR